jgi:flagellar basal body-associated protein FliL
MEIRVRFNLKNLKLICIISLLAVLFVSVGIVSAQTTNEATVTSSLSTYTVPAGGSVSVTVTVHNTVSTDFKILRIGFHGDWMGKDSSGNDNFKGPNFSYAPEDLPAGGSYSGSFLIDIPSSATLGAQSYYIGVDAQDSSGQYYYWNSQSGSLQIVPAGSTSSSTPTSAPTQDGDNGQTTDYLFYIAIVAIIVMVVLVLMVILTMRKRSRPRTPPSSTVMPPLSETKPEPKPQEESEDETEPESEKEEEQPPPKKKPSQGEDFDI